MTRFVIFIVFLLACTTLTKESRLIQTNPLKNKVPPYQSFQIEIKIKDHELPSGFKLRQAAQLFILSRDRIKVRVLLSHKWKEMVDIENWKATLKTSRGTYWPDLVEQDKTRPYIKVWEEVNSRNMLPLISVDAFIGTGEIYFVSRNIIEQDTKFVTFTLVHESGIKYVFSWEFIGKE